VVGILPFFLADLRRWDGAVLPGVHDVGHIRLSAGSDGC